MNTQRTQMTRALLTALLALSLLANAAGAVRLLRAPPMASRAERADAPATAPASVPPPPPAETARPASADCTAALAAAQDRTARLRDTVVRTAPAPTAYRWSAPSTERTGRWQAFLERRARELGLDDGSVTGDCHEQGCKLIATAEADGARVTALDHLSASPILRSCCAEIARGPSRAVRDPIGGRPLVVAEYYVRLRPDFNEGR